MYLSLNYPSNMEVETLRQVSLTNASAQWNPDSHNDCEEDDQWYDCLEQEDNEYALDDDEFFETLEGFVLESNYCNERVVNNINVTHPDLTCDAEARRIYDFECKIAGATGRCKLIDFEKLCPFFLWKPVETIKNTFAATTQFIETVWYNSTPRMPLLHHFKSHAPFMNFCRLNEGYTMDTIFANCKVHDGSTCAQIYVGIKSQFVSIEGMTSKAQMPRHGALLNFIRFWGAMKYLKSNMVKEENSKAVNHLLRAIHAPNCYSEPYNEHQNPADRKNWM